MQVHVPYTRLDPVCVASVGEAVYHEMGADPYAYWRLVRGLWQAGEPFILVEHDIEVRPETLTGLADCERPWCVASYRHPAGWWLIGLGCTKLDPSRLPVLDWSEPVHWSVLDVTLGKWLAPDAEPHQHGEVEHRNPLRALRWVP